jgi:hypothetical protein
MKNLLVVMACALCACGSPANVAGNYSVNLTNKDNGCNFANWTVGQMTSGIAITVTQSGGDVTATVGGLGGAFLTAVLGSASFTGTADGNAIDLKLFGTRSATMSGCAYTVNAHLTGGIAGDLLEGSIEYTPATNGSPDCGVLATCTNAQAFNGTRPPQ